MSEIKSYAGNYSLMDLFKTAFLCSRKFPAGAVLKCYDWATEQRDANRCVISGFHSTIEKDVFHYLLKGDQPIIMMLARGIGPKVVEEFSAHIDAGRLLIASPFGPEQTRADKRSAAIRNRLMIELADQVVVGYSSPDGGLAKVLKDTSTPVRFL